MQSLNLHNIKQISLGRNDKMTTSEGVDFWRRTFLITNDKGDVFDITTFGESEKDLEIKF